MSFDPTKPVKFVDRPDVTELTILATDLTGDFPILSKYRCAGGCFTIRHRANGETKPQDAFPASAHRLINIPEEEWRDLKHSDVNGPILVREKGKPETWAMVTGCLNGRLKVGLIAFQDYDPKDFEVISHKKHEVSYDLGKTWQRAGVRIQ